MDQTDKTQRIHRSDSVFMTYVCSGEMKVRRYSNDPCTYSRCKEHVGGYSVVLGGFAPSGLCVNSSHYDSDISGVGALRRF